MHGTELIIRFAACLAGLLIISAQAAAGDQAAYELPEGRELLDLRWQEGNSLLLLQRGANEIVVSRISADADRIEDLVIPRSLQRSTGNNDLFSYALAPLGNALAVVERNPNLVRASRLSVYAISGTDIYDVSTYHMPEDFWPGAMCWDEAGDNLFVAARPYLRPTQTVGLGVFSLDSARFTALLQRKNVDQVRAMAFLPGSGELAVLCGSYEGEFPLEDMVVLVNPHGNATRIAHGRAGQGAMQLLDDGSLLLRCSTDGRQQDWLMPAGQDEFQLLGGGGLPAWGCQVSRDGSWLAGLQHRGGAVQLQVQSRDGAMAYTSDVDAALWRFRPDGSQLAIYDAGSAVISLPEVETSP